MVILYESSGIISEVEGSIQQKYKRTLFPYKKLLKGTTDFSNPYVHSIFTLLLMKPVFEKISHQGQRLKAG